jgi:hypothetical protein
MICAYKFQSLKVKDAFGKTDNGLNIFYYIFSVTAQSVTQFEKKMWSQEHLGIFFEAINWYTNNPIMH